jgi:hypothetical protein
MNLPPIKLSKYFGAALDGKTDDTKALQLALAVGGDLGQDVVIPAGVTVAYSSALDITGIELVGGIGATLHALAADNIALILNGTEPAVRNLRLTGIKPPGRLRSGVSARVFVRGASDFTVSGMRIESGASSGILMEEASSGTVSENSIGGQLADFIHISNRSHDILVEENTCDGATNDPGTGDDGIAVVSYRRQGAVCYSIVARRNTIRNLKGGRAMSIVGGSHVTYENNMLTNNPHAAGLYICREKGYDTFGVTSVTAFRNTLVDCGNSAERDHPAIMLFTDDVEPNRDVSIVGNLVLFTEKLASRDGVFLYGQRQTEVRVEGNLVVGARKDYRIGTPGVSVVAYSSGAVGVI